jgi:hypothetical protein
MLVADVDVHQLGGKVNVTFPVYVPEIDPFGSRYWYWGGSRLNRPGEKGILTVQFNHLLRAQSL